MSGIVESCRDIDAPLSEHGFQSFGKEPVSSKDQAIYVSDAVHWFLSEPAPDVGKSKSSSKDSSGKMDTLLKARSYGSVRVPTASDHVRGHCFYDVSVGISEKSFGQMGHDVSALKENPLEIPVPSSDLSVNKVLASKSLLSSSSSQSVICKSGVSYPAHHNDCIDGTWNGLVANGANELCNNSVTSPERANNSCDVRDARDCTKIFENGSVADLALESNTVISRIIHHPGFTVVCAETFDDTECCPEVSEILRDEMSLAEREGLSLRFQLPHNVFYIQRVTDSQDMQTAKYSICIFNYRVQNWHEEGDELECEATRDSTFELFDKLREGTCKTEDVSHLGHAHGLFLVCLLCHLKFGAAESFVTHARSVHCVMSCTADVWLTEAKSAILQKFGKDCQPAVFSLKLVSVKSVLSAQPEKTESAASADRVLNSPLCDPQVWICPKYPQSKSLSGFVQHAVVENNENDMNASDDQVLSKPNNDGKFHSTTKGTGSESKISGTDMSISDLLSGGRKTPKELSLDLTKTTSQCKISPGLNLPDETVDSSNVSSTSYTRPLSDDIIKAEITADEPLPSRGDHVFTYAVKMHPDIECFSTFTPSHEQKGTNDYDCLSRFEAESLRCDEMESMGAFGLQLPAQQSRNSCKMLKCPRCNWHYKYQETLEIHMREKHPETDAQCVYCIGAQPHPRLARGEAYTCGYKPYRCDVCNYSTTTKGNLSIHMQSDRHMNNVQEVQSVGARLAKSPPTPPPPSTMSADVCAFKKSKPKPSWRCDVCNYETNVARNLRIHMTSEKHAHNILVMQQSSKSMSSDLQMQLNHMAMVSQDTSSLLALSNPWGMAPFAAFEQSMFMRPPLPRSLDLPVDLTRPIKNSVEPHAGLSDWSGSRDLESPMLYQCMICNAFGTDSLEALHQHEQLDRTGRGAEHEGIIVIAGTYICSLCQYKSNLKANFQLHCKTDKHLQRLQLINHIREGRPNIEWRHLNANLGSLITVRCNACDYSTNSVYKMQIHSSDKDHNSNVHVFLELLSREKHIGMSKAKYYHCATCDFTTHARSAMIQHASSAQHCAHEQQYLAQLGQRDGGTGLGFCFGPFSVREFNQEEDGAFADHDHAEGKIQRADQKLNCPVTNEYKKHINENGKHITESFSADHGEAEEHDVISDQRRQPVKQSHSPASPSLSSPSLTCRLCLESVSGVAELESHLVQMHSVKPQVLKFLLKLVEQNGTQTPSSSSIASLSDGNLSRSGTDWSPGQKHLFPSTEHQMERKASSPASDVKMEAADDSDLNLAKLESEGLQIAKNATSLGRLLLGPNGEQRFQCQTCGIGFAHVESLYAHQTELGHLELKQTKLGPSYPCWHPGCDEVFSTAVKVQTHHRQIHVDGCAFTTEDELELYRHVCTDCSLSFRCLDHLRIHQVCHLVVAAEKCSLCLLSFESLVDAKEHFEMMHANKSDDGASLLQEAIQALTSLSVGRLNGSLDQLEEAMETDGLEGVPGKNECCHSGNCDYGVCTDDFTLGGVQQQKELQEPVEMEEDHEDEDEESMRRRIKLELQQIPDDRKAAGHYSDPNFKYKCHRCKMAFIRQSHLSAHNKMPAHRRGDRFINPVDKYLDPDRPFKCDLCRESFTQKNILLVHYNSVSHLHKVKHMMSQMSTDAVASSAVQMDGSRQAAENHPLSDLPSTVSEDSIDSGAAVGRPDQASLVTDDVHRLSPGDSQDRPHGFASCSLDDHEKTSVDTSELSEDGKRVLSQMKTEQLQQEQSGCEEMLQKIDERNMLGLNPDRIHFEDRKTARSALVSADGETSRTTVISDQYNGHRSHNSSEHVSSWSSAISCIDDSPLYSFPNISSYEATALASISSAGVGPNTSLASALLSQSGSFHSTAQIFSCSKCMTTFTSHDDLAYHQQTGCGFSHLAPRSPPKTFYYRSLLENIGFECVMQFNESSQQKAAKVSHEKERKSINGVEKCELETVSAETDKKLVTIPELSRSVCDRCQKEFSSIWVLKTHKEEVHRQTIPLNLIEEFASEFKKYYELRLPTPISSEAPQSPTAKDLDGTVSANHANLAGPEAAGYISRNLSSQMMHQMSMMLPFDMMGFGLPVGMNLLPPVLPMMMPFGHPSEMYGIPGLGLIDPSLLLSSHQHYVMPPPQPYPPVSLPQYQQQQQPQQVQNSLMVAQQKRARTRISDEQLSILRAHFDISNSPSDEQVSEMAEKTKLPPKVIKHWFRNTLFKERQRSKDSPYNFNIPPTTILEAETEKHNASETQTTGILSAESGRRSAANRCDSAAIEMKQDNFCLETQSTRSSDSFDDGLRHSDSSTPLSVVTQTVFSMGPQNAPSRFVPSSSFCLPGSLSGHTTAAMSCGALFGVASLAAAQQGQNQMRDTSSSSRGPGSHGKRANRTHFTDHQIKILQEHFELNAYPKDEELEMLSRLLELSPRVIIVWFQNARQKARKTYENQPPVDGNVSASSASGGGAGTGDGTSQTQSTTAAAALKYQCPTCSVVFERYYELIKHHRTQCNQDSKTLQPDPQMSPFASECSSSDDSLRHRLDVEAGKAIKENARAASPPKGDYISEKGNDSFQSLEKQKDHEDNTQQSPANIASISSRSSFNVLKEVASQQGPCSSSSGAGSFPDEQASYEEGEDKDALRDRRMRTTILPEQLEYLSLKYKADCNPSRKQLSAIAAEVGLKKRVVQVWFQNTRARERKGQYRIHPQSMASPVFHHSQQFFPTGSVISKPSHSAGKHVEKQENVIREEYCVSAEEGKYKSPGYDGGNPHGVDFAQLINNPYNMPSPFLPLVPPLNLIYGSEPFSSESEFSKSSFRRNFDMLSGSRTDIQKSFSTSIPTDEPYSHRNDDLDVPLDLSKTYRVNYESKSSATATTSVAAAAGAMFGLPPKTAAAAATDAQVSHTRSCDDSQSESQSEFVENTDETNQGAEGKGQSSRISTSVHSSQGQTFPGKRHRTHMSSLQIRVMKAIYADYKTPTIAECDALGHEIGLRKRVVQVWFQNARAKDKKNRLAADGSVYNGGADGESLHVPDQCLYCRVKYSTQFTLRDHLFSTQHIDVVKKFVRAQADSDNRSAVEETADGSLKSVRKSSMKKYSSSASSFPSTESLGDGRTHKSGTALPSSTYDADKHSAAYPTAVKSEKGASGSLSLGESKPKTDISVAIKSDPKVVDSCFMSAIGGSSSRSSSMVNAEVMPSTNSPQKISPYGPSFYPSLPGMLPFMYPGLGSFYPGLDIPFLPSQVASTGMDSFYLSDPTSYGLPLSMLQISRPALLYIQEKVSDKETTVARYTEDSMTFADLKSAVCDLDFSIACESSVDVGYICKQCHLVFPGYSACTNHQQNSCFLGKTVDEAACTVKLVQTVYECMACHTKLSTVADYKVHCDLESHRLKVSGST